MHLESRGEGASAWVSTFLLGVVDQNVRRRHQIPISATEAERQGEELSGIIISETSRGCKSHRPIFPLYGVTRADDRIYFDDPT